MAAMILRAVGLAISQMAHQRFLKIVALGVSASLGALVALAWVLRQGLSWLIGDGFTVPYWGEITISDQVIGFASIGTVLALSIFLMVPIAQAVQSVFLDEVADAVEDRHYPDRPRGQAMPFGDALLDGLRAFGVLILANLLALILYVVIPPFAPVIFVAVNGFLIGREYFFLAAQRHLPRAHASALGRRHIAAVWALGALMVVPLTVPVVNLFIPVLCAASFTHLYHMLTAHR